MAFCRRESVPAPVATLLSRSYRISDFIRGVFGKKFRVEVFESDFEVRHVPDGRALKFAGVLYDFYGGFLADVGGEDGLYNVPHCSGLLKLYFYCYWVF